MDNNYDNLMEIIKKRRSVRIVEDKAVSDEVIKKVTDAGRWAPSACNKQGWKFIVLNNIERKNKLAEKFKAAVDRKFIKKAPNIIFVFYDKTASPENYAYIQSASAAIQNMLLASESLGLGATWYNSIPFEPVKSFFNVPDNYHYIAAVVFGFIKKKQTIFSRKELKSVCLINPENFPPDNYGSDPENWSVEGIKELIENQIYATAPEWGGEYENPATLSKTLSLLDSRLENKKMTCAVYLPEPGGIFIELLRIKPAVKFDFFCAGKKSLEWFKERLICGNIAGASYNLITIDDYEDSRFANCYEGVILYNIFNRLPAAAAQKLIIQTFKNLRENGAVYSLMENKFSYRALPLIKKSFCYMNHFGPFKFLNPFAVEKYFKDYGGKLKINTFGVDLMKNIPGVFNSFLKYFCRIILHKAEKNG